MTEKLNEKSAALSFAIVVTVVSLVCAALFMIAPSGILSFFNNVFHGIDLTQIAKSSLTFGGIVIGLIEVFISSLIAGWLFAVVYNKLG